MAQIILRFLCAVSVNPLSLIFSVTLFLRLFLILMLSFSLSELFNLKFIRTILTFSPSVSRSRPHWLVKIGSAILLNLLTQAKQPIILPKKKVVSRIHTLQNVRQVWKWALSNEVSL